MKEIKENIISWIQNYFKETNGKGAVVGVSGGKDSSTVCKLMVEALGKENVFAVLMPNGEQKDISDSQNLVKLLDVRYKIVNINDAYNGLLNAIGEDDLSSQGKINMSPRLRMTTLYAIASSLDYRVAGTGNKSEGFVGYTTKWGDNACDFNPIAGLTKEEVVALGDELGLPKELTHKAPSDGISGLTDEDNLGFKYEDINKYMSDGTTGDLDLDKKIEKTHKANLHKSSPIVSWTK